MYQLHIAPKMSAICIMKVTICDCKQFVHKNHMTANLLVGLYICEIHTCNRRKIFKDCTAIIAVIVDEA